MARFILTLVRHGQTIYNQDGIIQGQMDVPLSEEGRKQIWLLAKALEQHRFTKIFASDLQRATETAQAIVDHGTVERPKVVTDQRLRERGYGRLEGIPVKEYQGQARKGKHHKHFTPEGGETIDQVRKRAVSFFKELCDDFLEGNALQNPPTKCTATKKTLKSEDGTNSSAATPTNPESSIASSGVSASNEVDVPPVEFTVGPSSDDEDPRDQADGSSEGLTSDVQTCLPSKPQQSGSKTPQYHRQSPLSNQYAPNVTLSSSSMGGSESQEGAIEISYSEGSLCSQDTDDFDEDVDLEGMVADILVVAHGVLIRELMRYFIEDLNCFVPKGPSLANRVTFNTGMSRFQVDLLDGFPKMECLSIHQIDHLHQL
ncbi:fructose-2,6-bisphosphatase TIGAR-like [Patiria miniata]|uniref:Fructose-2,6-bisphosphatase TIGAR n=1 Tax=Patiria miniata TaxID=46514 RepID=A0A914BBJ2_PATMI|nr:fructose-2,6-bisphosphatase TIGAR-like [Patiria miniata]